MQSCFSKENPKIGSDLVVVHKERYMRPNFNSFGKRGEVLLCQKEMPLETTSLFLERQILYLEISQFEIITRTFKIRTTI